MHFWEKSTPDLWVSKLAVKEQVGPYSFFFSGLGIILYCEQMCLCKSDQIMKYIEPLFASFKHISTL